ncbi:F-box domain-containing protein [Penicillium malachiteum]|nr:F-box domain-containing protein [Penicillium malachiteum]
MAAPYLPFEIIWMILTFVPNIETLFVLRLLNTDWFAAVNTRLQEVIFCDWRRRGQQRLEHAARNLAVARQVRDLVVKFPDDHFHQDYDTKRNGRAIKLQRFFKNKVPRLTELESLCIRVETIRAAPQKTRDYFIDKRDYIDGLMKTIFEVLARTPKLKAFSTDMLPHYAFLPAMGNRSASAFEILRNLGLESLKLGYTTAESDKECDSYVEPTRNWLVPLGQRLRHLSITCWGFNLLDMRGFITDEGCNLPTLDQLESLELRGHAFFEDDVLNWILASGKRLTTLILDDCAIVYGAQAGLLPKEAGRTAVVSFWRADDDQFVHIVLNDSRWSKWFNLFKEGLPKLSYFRMGNSRIRRPGEHSPFYASERFGTRPPFMVPKTMFGLFADRYLGRYDEFADVPLWVLDFPADTNMVSPGSDDLAADLEALRGLFAHIGQTVPEDATSDHAGYVRGLVGHVQEAGRIVEEVG